MTSPASSSPSSLPSVVDVLAGQIVALYTQAEQQLMADIAKAARGGVIAPAFSAERLAMQAQMLRAAERVATMLRLRSYPLAMQVAQEAAVHGEQAATVMLRRLVQSDPLLRRVFLDRARGHAVSSANQIGYDLAIRLDQTVPRVLRFADDAYRAAVQEAATRQVLAIDTPSTAQSFAWRKLTERGVTGLTDVSGRNWNLSTYAEMATRTAVQRAYNASHLDRMATVGIEYFTVSHDGHPCPLCLPWEGEILSTGSVGEVSTLAADRDEQVTFTVKATVDDAIAAGFQHPNCRHVLLPYLPGVTKTTTGQAWTDADQRRYDDTQRLREMERNVRAAKRETAAALTPLERQRAEAKVRAWQARIRQHVEASGLVRKPRRERLDLGNH